MFDREVALYLKHQKEGLKISFLTYGDESELEYSERIPGIDILYNKWGYLYYSWQINFNLND